jgi:hypothetical protein
MREIIREVAVTAGVSAIIALLAFGAGVAVLTMPDEPLPPPLAVSSGCSNAPVTQLAGSGLRGSARLCFSDEAVRPAMRVEGLTPGEAYTAWLAYFDRPLACKQTPCSGADVLGKDPVGTLGRMDGIVADGTRTAELHGDLRDLRVSGGSQVALLLFGHGAARQGNGGRNHHS